MFGWFQTNQDLRLTVEALREQLAEQTALTEQWRTSALAHGRQLSEMAQERQAGRKLLFAVSCLLGQYIQALRALKRRASLIEQLRCAINTYLDTGIYDAESLSSERVAS